MHFINIPFYLKILYGFSEQFNVESVKNYFEPTRNQN